jgi:hypothetical protein
LREIRTLPRRSRGENFIPGRLHGKFIFFGLYPAGADYVIRDLLIKKKRLDVKRNAKAKQQS